MDRDKLYSYLVTTALIVAEEINKTPNNLRESEKKELNEIYRRLVTAALNIRVNKSP